MNKSSLRKFLLYSFLTVLVSLTMERIFHQVLRDRSLAEQVTTVQIQTGSIRSRLESVLSSDLLIVNSVAAYITVHPDLTDQDFTRFAAEVYEDATALHNLVAAPDLVIRHVYPQAGNEAIVNVDYRDIPHQLPLVREAMERGTLIVAGPVETIQGGPGLLSRVPVFLERDGVREPWGVVSALIRLERLFGVVTPLVEMYDVQIAVRGMNGTGETGPVFYGDAGFFDADTVVLQEILLPNGSWQIAVVPRAGWVSSHPYQGALQIAMTLVALLIILAIYIKVQSDQALQQSETRFRDVAMSTSDWIWEIDTQGYYRYASGKVASALGLAPEELIGKPYIEFVDEPFREAVWNDLEIFFRRREPITDYESWHVGRSGQRVYFLTNGVPILDERGDLVGYRGVHKDITIRKTLQNQLERFVAIVDEYVIISQTDLKGKITQVSSAFLRISGFSREELIGSDHRALCHPDMPDELFADLGRTIRAGETWHGEIKDRRKDGEPYWVDTDVSPLLDHNGKAYGYMAVRQDITPRKALERVSVTDRLTGLYNRQKLDEVLAQEWERFNRYGEIFSVIILDIDHFKPLNDTWGHLAGDEVLRTIGTVFRKHSRVADVAGRWGGEEFLIICPHTGSSGALALAEALRTAVETQQFVVNRTVTISYGVSTQTVETAYTGIDSLLVAADRALYRAKESGRNRGFAADMIAEDR